MLNHIHAALHHMPLVGDKQKDNVNEEEEDKVGVDHGVSRLLGDLKGVSRLLGDLKDLKLCDVLILTRSDLSLISCLHQPIERTKAAGGLGLGLGSSERAIDLDLELELDYDLGFDRLSNALLKESEE